MARKKARGKRKNPNIEASKEISQNINPDKRSCSRESSISSDRYSNKDGCK